jgi:hypothetical protein
MSVSINITETIVLAALRAFLITVLPSGVEVIAAQDNRVPEPVAPDFITMNSIGQARLATNTNTYSDGYPTVAGIEKIKQPTQYTIQLDVHGPSSTDNTEIITTLFRDAYAVDMFRNSGFDIAPLYANDPKQVPFINSEQQYENRWIIELAIQYTPTVQIGMEFFTAAEVNLVHVDVTYTP